jgi:3-oxoacyl-[acyl-carrier-protein] synthase II
MSRIFVHGVGAVSPAGWGVPALNAALKKGEPLPTQPLPRPGWENPLRIRAVPMPSSPPPFASHPRLRRASAITQYTVAAACEALGRDLMRVQNGELRLGVVVCLMPGCVAYSRRFYEEVLRDPATASPLIFPETVFNAPASHLSAYLNSPAVNYTLVGDDGAFLQGVALAADWLEDGRADACVVVGAEETDWIAADAVRLFRRSMIYSGGAGALYLKKIPGAAVELAAITGSFPFTQTQSRADAARKMQAQLPALAANELFCAGDDEKSAEPDFAGKHLTPGKILGESFVALAAWQCVAACDLIRRKKYAAANVSVVGANQQAVGARFVASPL